MNELILRVLLICMIFVVLAIININKKLDRLKYIQSYSICESIIKKEITNNE